MAKTSDKERQVKRREKLKNDKASYDAYLQKDRSRKKLKRLQDKKKPKHEEDAFRTAERLRVAKYRKLKKEREQASSSSAGLSDESPFRTKQSTGKAIKRVEKSLPKSPRKKMFVLAKMANEAGLEIKSFTGRKSCNKGLSDQECEIVKNFYLGNDFSWQAPGRKDRAILREVVNGKKTKVTKQIRYMLMSLKEAYDHFQYENPDVSVGLSKFCSLRPFYVKPFDQIPHNVCVCKYHENVRLILIVLEKYINISSDFSSFVDQVTCDQTNKDCVYRKCNDCKNDLSTLQPPDEVKETLTTYQQWQSEDKSTEKVTITASVDEIFEDLKNQLNGFLIHRYVKRIQQAHFTKLIDESNGTSIVLQVDFSENASIVHQNEIQSAHWSHQQVTLFTGHAWIDNTTKESFVIVSDNLEHTKEAVYAFMSELFSSISKKYPSVKLINVFTDGPTSQFKQRYLFSNLPGWEEDLSVKIIWNFFATSHGKGAVDGIGGTVKRSIWRHVRSKGTTPLNAVTYAELAKELNKQITIIYISSEDVATKSSSRLATWEKCLAIPGTMKLHCIKVRNAKQLEVATTSTGEPFKVAKILSGPTEEPTDESDSDEPNDESNSTDVEFSVQGDICVGDWVLVRYENETFPGEVTAAVGGDIEVNVMHRSGTTFWKWPAQTDKIYYTRDDILKKLDHPIVAGTRGQFSFKL